MASSDERKCIKCDFSAPVSDWKVWPEGHPFNKYCYDCRTMQCKVCDYSGQVRVWRIEVDGVSSLRCLKCTGVEFNKCTSCDFEGPLSEWKMKKGVPTKWCNRCLEWARKKSKKIRDDKREDYPDEDY